MSLGLLHLEPSRAFAGDGSIPPVPANAVVNRVAGR